jgi:hypothetical protein
MACLLMFGSLPIPGDRNAPTEAEEQVDREQVRKYQAVLDTH